MSTFADPWISNQIDKYTGKINTMLSSYTEAILYILCIRSQRGRSLFTVRNTHSSTNCNDSASGAADHVVQL